MKKHLNTLLLLTLSITSLSSFANDKNPLSNKPQSPNGLQMLSSFLIAANGNLADGNRVVFASQYSNAVDGNDAMKMTNPGENFGLYRDNKFLAVEARQPLAAGDTIYYRMGGTVEQIYQLVITPSDLMNANVKGTLIDRYANTRTEISLMDTNRLNLGVNADPDSKSPNRLMIVFSQSATLPIKFAGISAVNEANKSVTINWSVEDEAGIDRYEVERSADGINFSRLNLVTPKYKNVQGGAYNYRDISPLKSANFYRIKSFGADGKVTYSNVAKATIFQVNAGITVYPNPVKGNTVKLQFNQATKGMYRIMVANSIGQVVHRSNLRLNDSNYNHTLNMGNAIIPGNYTVCVFDEEGTVSTQSLIVQ